MKSESGLGGQPYVGYSIPRPRSGSRKAFNRVRAFCIRFDAGGVRADLSATRNASFFEQHFCDDSGVACMLRSFALAQTDTALC